MGLYSVFQSPTEDSQGTLEASQGQQSTLDCWTVLLVHHRGLQRTADYTTVPSKGSLVHSRAH